MIFITLNLGPEFNKIPESLLFSVLERYIRYDSKTRSFFSENELKSLRNKKKIYNLSMQESQKEIIDTNREDGWEVDKKDTIKGCPVFYLRNDKNKMISLMASMDDKIYVFSQIYKVDKKDYKKSKKSEKVDKTKVSGTDIVRYFHVLYILYKNGTNIFEYRFRKEKYIDSDLLTSILTAIEDVLKEATGNLSSIQEINQGNLYIIFEHDKDFSTLLISDNNKTVIKKYLKKFNQLFIKRYNYDLKNWTGEISKFKETEQIIKKLFNIGDKPLESVDKKVEKLEKEKEKIEEKKKTKDSEGKEEKFESLKILEEEFYYFYCPKCNQWYKVVDYADNYDCLYCGTKLIDKTENVKKLKERKQKKDK
ncbi:MAG: hypothetical protein EU550_03115 [Promethearchaeota archaeon]|nr:MAG: hypothetical protein EU550_03115 [Candidatus Lokiarchaeota archaeon]